MPYHSTHALCGPKRLVLTRYPYSIISACTEKQARAAVFILTRNTRVRIRSRALLCSQKSGRGLETMPNTRKC